jgi:hypothetical protein
MEHVLDAQSKAHILTMVEVSRWIETDVYEVGDDGSWHPWLRYSLFYFGN